MKVYKIINDVDELIYIGSTSQKISHTMTDHRSCARTGKTGKLYNHMRDIGIEHFKILSIREYTDISKERLRYKEDKYIKKYNTVLNGLNNNYSFGDRCVHNKIRTRCGECKGSQMCEHNKRKGRCKICSPATCEVCQKIYPKENLKSHMKLKH